MNVTFAKYRQEPTTAVGRCEIIQGTYNTAGGYKEIRHYWHSTAWWNGHLISVETTPGTPPCEEHDLHEIDHYGHPTNELWCFECWGVASNPEPKRCTWAECWHHKEPNWCAAQGCH